MFINKNKRLRKLSGHNYHIRNKKVRCMYSLLELEAGRNSHLTSGTKGTVKTKTLLEISFGT